MRPTTRAPLIAAVLIAALAASYLPTSASAAIVRVPECKIKPATIVGTEGDDVLQGTEKNDVIAGLGGNDRLTGGGGQDLMCGGSGDDTVDGGAGFDKLSGDADNDTLLGEDGGDDVVGEEGNDTLVEPANDGETNALSGGPGIDDIEGGRGDDGIDGGTDGDKIKAGGGDDDVDGDDGDDDVDGGPGSDNLEGGDGKDIIKGGGAADTRLHGGDHDDVIDTGPGDDGFVFGVGGNDVLDGVGGNDRLVGGDGNDRLEGGPGKDFMSGGAAADRCGGGPARDFCDGGAPSPSNPDKDPDVCGGDVEKKVDCKEGDEFPVAWTGTAVHHSTAPDSLVVDANFRLTFERGDSPAPDEEIRGSDLVQARGGDEFADQREAHYVVTSGTGEWHISGTDGYGCTHSGSGTVTGIAGRLHIEPEDPTASPKPDSYRFELFGGDVGGTVTMSCPEHTEEYVPAVGPDIDLSPHPWSPEMTRLTGTTAGGTFSWDFTASP